MSQRDLCIMACVFCREPLFHRWMHTQPAGLAEIATRACSADIAAKTFILQTCGITSRNDLDRNPAAADRFHELIRKPFLEWKDRQPEL